MSHRRHEDRLGNSLPQGKAKLLLGIGLGGGGGGGGERGERVSASLCPNRCSMTGLQERS